MWRTSAGREAERLDALDRRLLDQPPRPDHLGEEEAGPVRVRRSRRCRGRCRRGRCRRWSRSRARGRRGRRSRSSRPRRPAARVVGAHRGAVEVVDLGHRGASYARPRARSAGAKPGDARGGTRLTRGGASDRRQRGATREGQRRRARSIAGVLARRRPARWDADPRQDAALGGDPLRLHRHHLGGGRLPGQPARHPLRARRPSPSSAARSAPSRCSRRSPRRRAGTGELMTDRAAPDPPRLHPPDLRRRPAHRRRRPRLRRRLASSTVCSATPPGSSARSPSRCLPRRSPASSWRSRSRLHRRQIGLRPRPRARPPSGGSRAADAVRRGSHPPDAGCRFAEIVARRPPLDLDFRPPSMGSGGAARSAPAPGPFVAARWRGFALTPARIARWLASACEGNQLSNLPT